MKYYLQEGKKMFAEVLKKKFAEETFLYPHPLQEINWPSLTAGIWLGQPWLNTCHLYSVEPC